MKAKFIIPLVVVFLPILGILFINNFYSRLPKDVMTEGVVGQPRNIHPLRMGNNPVDEDLVALLYRGLFAYDLNGEIYGDLAESWEISDDGLVYTIRLRKGEKWHDGKSFGADDVVFTTSRHEALKQVKVEKIDDHTVTFTLKEKYSPFLDLLTTPIAPEHISLDSPGLQAIGTGEFALDFIDPAPNFIQAIHLIRVKNLREGTINKIILRFYNDREELKTAIQLGEVDIYGGEPIPWPGFHTEVAAMKGINYAILINMKKGGLLADIDFRKTIAQSTPRSILANQVLGGRYSLTDGPIHDSWASEDDVERYYFAADVEPKYEGEFTLVISDTEDNLAVGKTLKESWGRLGIDINVRIVAPDKLEEKVLKDRDFDFLLLGREVSHDPDRYSYWHSTQIDYPGLNVGGYKQVRVDKALEKGRQTISRDERREHYSLFQKLVASDVPAIELYQPRYFFTIRNTIKEVDLRDLYQPKDRYKSINNWFISLP